MSALLNDGGDASGLIIRRERLLAPAGEARVRYVGMFQCLCGHKFPSVAFAYSCAFLAHGFGVREYIRHNRREACEIITEQVRHFIACNVAPDVEGGG